MNKMRISKIMVALLVSVVAMTAMTGVAVADPDQMAIVYDGTNTKVYAVNIPLGGSIDLDINISEFLRAAGTIHNLTVGLHDSNMTPRTGLQVNISEQDDDGPKPNGSWNEPADNPVVRWNQTPGKGGYERFDLKITDNASVVTAYTVKIEDFVTGQSVSLSAATIEVSPVPEFATIALPALSILGLFMYFRHKRKNE